MSGQAKVRYPLKAAVDVMPGRSSKASDRPHRNAWQPRPQAPDHIKIHEQAGKRFSSSFAKMPLSLTHHPHGAF
jgi:hypothetical protein